MSNRRRAHPTAGRAGPAHPPPAMTARQVLAAIRDQVTAELEALPGRPPEEARRRLADGEARLLRQARRYQANGRPDLAEALRAQAARLAAAEIPDPPA